MGMCTAPGSLRGRPRDRQGMPVAPPRAVGVTAGWRAVAARTTTATARGRTGGPVPTAASRPGRSGCPAACCPRRSLTYSSARSRPRITTSCCSSTRTSYAPPRAGRAWTTYQQPLRETSWAKAVQSASHISIATMPWSSCLVSTSSTAAASRSGSWSARACARSVVPRSFLRELGRHSPAALRLAAPSPCLCLAAAARSLGAPSPRALYIMLPRQVAGRQHLGPHGSGAVPLPQHGRSRCTPLAAKAPLSSNAAIRAGHTSG
mmetsp:Transcript_114085/g.317595  ORF Transcript_114085/g.317595 Transcript_114085/m.317595 type:complete len:263 (+) Transcript_114085:773-1561(+)